jgi:hypothetical protein
MCNPIQSVTDVANNIGRSIADIVRPVDPLGANVLAGTADAADNPNVQKVAPIVAAGAALYFTGGAVGGETLATIGGDAGATLTAGQTAAAVVDGASIAADGTVVADAVAGGASAAVGTAGSTVTLADITGGAKSALQLAGNVRLIQSLANPKASANAGFAGAYPGASVIPDYPVPFTPQATTLQAVGAGTVSAGNSGSLTAQSKLALLAVAGLTIWGLNK